MTQQQQAVFKSVSQALHVAFLIASLPVTKKGPMQAALEHLMKQAGIRTEHMRDSNVNFRGLSPLEVRGQCAMVRAAVLHHCTEMERHAIHAWYALDEAKADGVRALRDFCAPRLTIESPQARMLLVWHVHAQGRARDICTERAIAAEHGLSQSTVHRNVVVVGQTAGKLRRAGMERLEQMFQRDGLVEASDQAVSC
jgi:hypothetical protein